MATNYYISKAHTGEARLHADLVQESIAFAGVDVLYLPREIVDEDAVFGEVQHARFKSAYTIEAMLDTNDEWDGDGEVFSKFGIELRPAITLNFSRSRFKQLSQLAYNDIKSERPRESDLIFLPFANKMFTINFVEHESIFYQFLQTPVYRCTAELYELGNATFDTDLLDDTLGDSDSDALLDSDSTQNRVFTEEADEFFDADTLNQANPFRF